MNQNTVPYSAVDTHYLQHIENALDQVIQTKALAHGFTYVHTWAGSADHTLCATDPYILGIGFTNDDELGTAVNSTPLPGLYATLGALHPNLNGVELSSHRRSPPRCAPTPTSPRRPRAPRCRQPDLSPRCSPDSRWRCSASGC